MSISNSNSKDNMSFQELIDELKKAEKTLFDLRFKKATRQPFKSHEIKATRKEVARIKTLLRDKV
uniref:Large ribosomal subunit protein uL29c n=1 Tax=Skeletonema marinoi TaxID=267567 RepID=A0A8K1LUF7_9STRA|nr:ribosomal protein L29 [Skeletonema marinoi]UAM91350.1 ribosomal protein L29 [Skeletonema marinoi]